MSNENKTDNGLHLGWYKQESKDDYLPPDNIEWMIPEYQNLSPFPAVDELGIEYFDAPNYISDTVNVSSFNSTTTAASLAEKPKNNKGKMIAAGVGVAALILMVK